MFIKFTGDYETRQRNLDQFFQMLDEAEGDFSFSEETIIHGSVVLIDELPWNIKTWCKETGKVNIEPEHLGPFTPQISNGVMLVQETWPVVTTKISRKFEITAKLRDE